MEATLALTLLTVGMLCLTGAFSQILKSNATVRQKQIAAFLASSKLAELCSSPLSEISQIKGVFDEPFVLYSWQVRFEYRSDNEEIADVWLEVIHKSGTSVKFWTQMMVDNAR